MIFTKVCGLRSKEEIDAAIDFGYDAIGVVLHKKSVRYVNAVLARQLAVYASRRISAVAVGVTYEEVQGVEDAFDYIQVYEACGAQKLIYAGTSLPEGTQCRYFMYDASRGSGATEEFPVFDESIKSKLIISGGLAVENVGTIIKTIHPFGVDVSSGVEKTRGVKDIALMKRFIAEVRNAENAE